MSKDSTLQELKKYFSKELYKGRILSWEEYKGYIYANNVDEITFKKLKHWFMSIINIDIFEDIQSNTEEIFIHKPNFIVIKTNHGQYQLEHERDSDDILLMLDYLSIKHEQNWNTNNPYVSFNISIHGLSYRATFIHSCLNPEGKAKAFLRLLKKKSLSLTTYENEKILESLIKNKSNFIVAGSTGSGKTTLINSMISNIDSHEHSIILEDTYELISPNERTTRLLANQKSLDELLTYSLRMSPDRIILGEIRSTEVLTFILGMNTGHKGMVSSIHANNAKDALIRVATLYNTYLNTKMSFDMTLKLICNNINHVVYIENKKIVEIIEVYGSEGQNLFYDSVI